MTVIAYTLVTHEAILRLDGIEIDTSAYDELLEVGGAEHETEFEANS